MITYLIMWMIVLKNVMTIKIVKLLSLIKIHKNVNFLIVKYII